MVGNNTDIWFEAIIHTHTHMYIHLKLLHTHIHTRIHTWINYSKVIRKKYFQNWSKEIQFNIKEVN